MGQGDCANLRQGWKKCLADYRQTTVFAQITAYACQVMHDAPPAKLSAILQQQARSAQAEFDATAKQVQAIVNQIPPTVVPPPNNQEIYHYDYHPGATKPDFNTADVLSTREPWNGQYVYMDTRPGVFYRSADCEFNPQTKFFYTRRDVPKKKLTDAENREVVRLYRILGKDESIINALAQRLEVARGVSTELIALNIQLGAN